MVAIFGRTWYEGTQSVKDVGGLGTETSTLPLISGSCFTILCVVFPVKLGFADEVTGTTRMLGARLMHASVREGFPIWCDLKVHDPNCFFSLVLVEVWFSFFSLKFLLIRSYRVSLIFAVEVPYMHCIERNWFYL